MTAKRRHLQSKIGILPALDCNAIKGISRPRNPLQNEKNHPEWGGEK
ncbi:MAG: hypothetical protein IJF45_04590 [Clostridia bacterium]|nr:hypothetical protein [Clostridia bacterium]